MGVLSAAGTIVIRGWHVQEQPPERLLRRLAAPHTGGARLGLDLFRLVCPGGNGTA